MYLQGIVCLFWSHYVVILLSSEYRSDLDIVTVSDIHVMLQGLCFEQLQPAKYLQQRCKNNPPLLCVEGKCSSG